MTAGFADEDAPEPPLLDLVRGIPDDRRFVFVSGDEGVVGWGEPTHIDAGVGPERYARARDGLTRLRERAGGLADPSGPRIAFASFSFDDGRDESVVVVPPGAAIRQGDITTIVGRDGHPPLGTLPQQASPSPSATSQDRPRYGGMSLRDDAWLEAVAAVLTHIEEGEVEKVVLARDLQLWSRTAFDTDRVLRDLSGRFPTCTTFLVDHLIGASPELLLTRSGTRIHSRVLAGTAPRSADDDEDLRLGRELLASEKDRHEHRLALDSAVASLAPFCVRLDVPASPSLVRLDNVQHLGSDISGDLRTQPGADPPHVLEVLRALHPTAAVGGVPSDAARGLIRQYEGDIRARYAGPVGWFDDRGDGAFAIALRCAEIRGNRARLFAGAGIVRGSLPEQELEETWLKLRAMTGVLDP